MAILRCMVVHNPGADPDARYVNTFHFDLGIGADRVVEAGNIETALLDPFWNSIDLFMSQDLSGLSSEYRWYDLSDPPERVPFAISPGPAKTTGTGRLPPELAICLTYRAQYVSGSSSARRRGRLYIGPLATGACQSTTGRIDSAYVSGIATAASTAVAASDAAANWKWAVYSRVDNAARIVTEGWVDNDFDIQRRRSLPPGAKTTWT